MGFNSAFKGLMDGAVGLDIDHSLPSSAKINKAEIYLCSPICLRDVDRKNLHFIFIFSLFRFFFLLLLFCSVQLFTALTCNAGARGSAVG